MAKSPSIEESFVVLEDIINKIENNNVTLEESFKLYSEGIKIIKNCNSQLDKVEKKIIVLEENGEQDGI